MISVKNKYNINIVINNCCPDDLLINRFFNLKQGKFYNLVKTIYERSSKGTYIIGSITSDTRYILKIKSDPNHEENIYKILSKKYHSGVAKFISLIKDNKFYYFIYEYIEGCNLLEYVKLNKITENDIKDITIQLINALEFLHGHNILHCDLKLENIMVKKSKKKNKEIKIIDFDLSVICEEEEGYVANDIFGTLQYIAPESYDLCIYSKKTDIWQIGIILYVLITNKFPHDSSEITLVNSYSNLCRQNVFKHIDLGVAKDAIIKKGYSLSLYNLLENMLIFDEKKRYGIDDIRKCEWLKNEVVHGS